MTTLPVACFLSGRRFFSLTFLFQLPSSASGLRCLLVVDSSRAWELTHSALLTRSLLCPFRFLLSSVPYFPHFPTLFNYLLFIASLLPSPFFCLDISTLFTSLLSSYLFVFTSLLSSHLFPSNCLTIIWCLFVSVCVFQCAAPPRCTRRHLPLLLTAESTHRLHMLLPSSMYLCIYASKHSVFVNHTSSTAQGGGGSFKNRKPIGEVGCCEPGMAERMH